MRRRANNADNTQEDSHIPPPRTSKQTKSQLVYLARQTPRETRRSRTETNELGAADPITAGSAAPVSSKSGGTRREVGTAKQTGKKTGIPKTHNSSIMPSRSCEESSPPPSQPAKDVQNEEDSLDEASQYLQEFTLNLDAEEEEDEGAYDSPYEENGDEKGVEEEEMYGTGSEIDVDEIRATLERTERGSEQLLEKIRHMKQERELTSMAIPNPPPAATVTVQAKKPPTGKRKGIKATTSNAQPLILETGTYQELSRASSNDQLLDFSINLWVDLNGVESKIEVGSLDSIGDVRQEIAREASVNVHSLQLVYKIEVDKSQKKPCRLTTEGDWRDVVKFAQHYRAVQAKANKPIDLWGVGVKDSQGPVAPVRGKASVRPTSGATTIPTLERSTPEPVTAAYVNLLKKLTCEKCGGKRCWIPGALDQDAAKRYGLTGFMHIGITDAETSKWNQEMSNGFASIQSPGPRLALEICKRFAGTQQKKAEIELAVHRSIPAPSATPSSRFDFAAASAPTPQIPRITPDFTAHSGVNTKVPCYFPIGEWLGTLNDRRDPEDPTDYKSMEQSFITEGIYSTRIIISLGVQNMIGVGGINRGIAANLFGWAVEDRDKRA
ncbi:hypothetical protein FRB91_003340 [Serendipita sp. 411]|nr:hypothetical protein FRB91_003340 [Serendipita sp. 411]